MTKKYIVNLVEKERKELEEIIKKGKNASKTRRAYILLGADEAEEGKQMTDKEISKAYNVSIRTVERLRERFVKEGYEIAVKGKPSKEPRARKIDGDVEAHLIALTRSEIPAGRGEWSLRLLASKMVEFEYIESISHESVRQVLKKTN